MSGKRFGRALGLLVAYLFVSPFIPSGTVASIAVHFLLSVALFTAALAVQRANGQRSQALGLMALTLTIYWLAIFKLVPFSTEAALILFICFYALLIYALTRQLLQATEVTIGVIAAALCIYLIIGLLWGAAYALIYELQSGTAFSGTLVDQADSEHIHVFNYFSIVTLTSLGYGDITPQNPGAASLCQMEAIIGQFFTAVLVGWLVGTYRRPSEREAKD